MEAGGVSGYMLKILSRDNTSASIVHCVIQLYSREAVATWEKAFFKKNIECQEQIARYTVVGQAGNTLALVFSEFQRKTTNYRRKPVTLGWRSSVEIERSTQVCEIKLLNGRFTFAKNTLKRTLSKHVSFIFPIYPYIYLITTFYLHANAGERTRQWTSWQQTYGEEIQYSFA